MAELIVIPVLIAAQRVIRSLKELESKKKYNTTIAREIEQFISSLDENIDLLKEELPKKDGSWALGKCFDTFPTKISHFGHTNIHIQLAVANGPTYVGFRFRFASS